MATSTGVTGTHRARRAPTQERSRRTVRQILEAAEQIVGEAGVEAASTRAIAERAGVAIPSLYRFFADRDEILDAVLEHMLSDLDERAAAVETAWHPITVEELIGLELDLHVGFYEKHPTAAALWFGGRASPAVTQAIRERNRRLAVRLRALMIGHGLWPETMPPKAVDLLVELGDRVLEVAFRSPRPPDRKALELGRSALAAAADRWTASTR
ncbi:MAG: TetR/AcrR family transcriptional regulator [Micromonosporaceae bacterium]